MRWGSQLVNNPEGTPERGVTQEALFAPADVVTRTFDTPEFRGMTFYEVQARTIINKVPSGTRAVGAPRVPFQWTINPYRGCGHACVYCLDSETPVALADGTTVPIGRLLSGEAILGTVPGSGRRHYVVTHVLDRWETVERAYRIRLGDGRELVAGAGHRFLTTDGWAFVPPEPAASAEAATDPGYAERAAEYAESTGLTDLAGRPLPVLVPGSRLLDCRPEPGEPRWIVGAPIPAESAIAVTAVEDLGEERVMVDLTTGTGDFIAGGTVSHNCFARNSHTWLEFDAGLDFDRKIVVKVNAAQRLRRELSRPSWGGDHIAMGTNVDCYQRAEGRYRLMPGIIAALRDAANPFSILTKGTLILRDLDLLVSAARRTDVGLAFSLGSVQAALWREVEPGTPSPTARLRAIRAMTDRGFAVRVLMAPILPYLSDGPDQLDETVAALAAAGASAITPLVLHLRPGAREWYFGWLEDRHPELVPRYRDMYGDRAYAPTSYQNRIAEMVAESARKHGIGGEIR